MRPGSRVLRALSVEHDNAPQLDIGARCSVALLTLGTSMLELRRIYASSTPPVSVYDS